MSTSLPFLRRFDCCVLLTAILSLAPCFAETNSVGIASNESGDAALSTPAETGDRNITLAPAGTGQRGATSEASISNAVPSATATPQSTIPAQAPIVSDFPTANVTGSFVRVMAMLAVVLGLFIGGVWLFRNWQRLAIHRGSAPKLNILETRSLGGRHALFVVGYENERLLVATSPAGINLLTHLPSADGTATPADSKPAIPQPTFAATLAQMLKGKGS